MNDDTPKRKYTKKNRVLELSLQDILTLACTNSGAGHPHDFIDGDTAEVKLVFKGKSRRPKVVIRWKGYPQDAPDYGDDPSVIEERKRRAEADRKDPYDVAA